MNRQIENSKKLLLHYFKVIAEKSGVVLDEDCETEINGIIDDLVEGIIHVADTYYIWDRGSRENGKYPYSL